MSRRLTPLRNCGYIRQANYKDSKPTPSKAKDGLKLEKARAVKAAKDLLYGDECINRILAAESEIAVGRILSEYRRKDR